MNAVNFGGSPGRLPWDVSLSLLVSEVFARAQALVDELDDAWARAHLAGLRQESMALPFTRQDHILAQVVALTEQLRRQQQARRPGPRSQSVDKKPPHQGDS